MKIFVLGIILLLPISIFSQIDSIEYEILNYKNSKLENISKARRLLLDKLVENDVDKTLQIKEYLILKTGNNPLNCFTLNEYWLLLFWTQQYDELLSSIEGIIINDTAIKDNSPSNSNAILPVDSLLQKLAYHSEYSKNVIEIVIDNSVLNDETKEFLKLQLDYCIFLAGHPAITQDSLNIASDRYLFKFPASPYRPFIRKYINYKIRVSNFAFGYDFYIGYGAMNGTLSDYLKDFAPFGFSIDLMIKNFDINLGIGMGVTTLEKDIVINNIKWESELKADIFYPTASIGYQFFSRHNINLTPFAGISNLSFGPSYQDMLIHTNLNQIEIKSTIGAMGGLAINFYSKPTPLALINHRSLMYLGFLKLKYTYYSSGYRFNFVELSGALHTITISFGILSKRIIKI